MKVKVGNKIYDGKKEVVMVILSKQDKINIANMLKTCTKYCEFPEDKYTVKEIQKWMK